MSIIGFSTKIELSIDVFSMLLVQYMCATFTVKKLAVFSANWSEILNTLISWNEKWNKREAWPIVKAFKRFDEAPRQGVLQWHNNRSRTHDWEKQWLGHFPWGCLMISQGSVDSMVEQKLINFTPWPLTLKVSLILLGSHWGRRKGIHGFKGLGWASLLSWRYVGF